MKNPVKIDYALQELNDIGLEYTFNSGHIQINHNGRIIDYWPSSGKWRDGNITHEDYGFGLKYLIMYIFE